MEIKMCKRDAAWARGDFKVLLWDLEFTPTLLIKFGKIASSNVPRGVLNLQGTMMCCVSCPSPLAPLWAVIATWWHLLCIAHATCYGSNNKEEGQLTRRIAAHCKM